MSRNTLFGIVMVAAAAIVSGGADAADPSLHQVYQAAEAGKMADAQAMMDQVLRDHPNSAKAHFVEAELMAKQGRFADAKSELATAERLAPGLPFAKAQAVQALSARLSGLSGMAVPGVQPVRTEAGHSFPWSLLLLGLGLVAFIVVVARFMVRRSAAPMLGAPAYGPAAPMQPYGNGGMGPMGTTGGGIGSGILGGLATGAAVGGGMVAGETLMRHFLGGDSGAAHAAPLADSGSFIPAQDDMGGADFGISDGSWDDGASLGGDDWN